ncbi:MAG: ABC transporter substrate-binding protein [Bdellovibrionales bacterium]|nr:ABC transporter substrate-binding protein [Bdellovibrionales bacterium]
MDLRKDHLGRELRLRGRPSRVVSLCPSHTETLAWLGLGDRLVARTRYCIHPRKGLASVPELGGTKNPDLDRLLELRPDLVIAEKEENPKEIVDALDRAGIPVYVTEVRSYQDAVNTVRDLGELLGCAAAGRELARRIEGALIPLRLLAEPLRVAYLIWRKPWMAAGAGTFIDSMLFRCGFENVFGENAVEAAARYPELEPEALLKADPDVVLLSSEPYPVSEKHARELRALLPRARVELADGEAFSWYGARLLRFAQTVNPLLRRLESAPPPAQ